MAEKNQMRTENIKKASELFKDGRLETLIKSSAKFESEAFGVKRALEEKLKALENAKKQAEQQKAVDAKKAELKKQQEAHQKALEQAKKDAEARKAANQKAIEQAKKDAEARSAARKKAVEEQKAFWTGLFGQK